MDVVARFGHLGGGMLTAAGVLGLAVTGITDPLAPLGQRLLLLEVNPAQNLLHVVVGLTMVAGTAGSPAAARTTALVTSAALGTLGLVGLALAGPTGNALALNGWSNALHLGLAGWGAVALLTESRHGEPTTTATRHP